MSDVIAEQKQTTSDKHQLVAGTQHSNNINEQQISSQDMVLVF